MDKGFNHNLDHCLKCSICHTQCPVISFYLSFPGPKQLGPELERLRLARGEKEFSEIDNVLSYCMNCKRCDIACPHGVKPSYYNLKNKVNMKVGPSEKFRNWILAHNVWWGKMASIIPGFSNFALHFPLIKFGMGVIGIANRNLPAYNKQKFKLKTEEKTKKALYYPGCFATFNEPAIIQSTINILESCGYQVKLAPVDCCGTPMLTNALFNETREIAGKNTALFLKYIEKGYKIVTTCSSCGLSLKQEYGDILLNEEAKILASHVWDLFELLEEEESLPFTKDKEKIDKAFYHVPCHLKAQGTGIPAAKILKEFSVKELIVEDSYCCGIAGTYGFKKEKHNLSLQIGSSLFKAIKESSPSLVITDCGTCKVQIFDGTGISVKHPALLLNEYLN
ncbi:MAG TPA: anaerobic glycerol-3-phosphate dehydrogenase subunit C [Candidatus Eremiobacteraeota bacterium]|nr:MAG: Anaerobic glycerol-3-phosphate dehydrogenase subunit C [bacterium ADurb.Bin363]HPZ09827.1 anaerobic glycerol-3-phosphate dehydrogenase subunit C [Candidatus Eremiobacteraeota bacterium]